MTVADATADLLIEQLTRIIHARIESDRLVLPAMPKVASGCLALLKDPDVATRRLVLVLETDPVFAVQISRAASTAAYGGQPARSLDTALSRLGINQLKVVVTEAAAHSLFTTPDRAIAARLAQVWSHSVAVAILAREVAGLLHLPDPASVYLTGLLHDVGKTVVATLLIEAEAQLGKKGWIDAEQWSRVVDATHRSIGVALAEKWNLDPEVVAAVRDCQDYASTDRRCMANVVRFANALVKANGGAGGPVDLDKAQELVTIGRAVLELEEESVVTLTKGLKARIEGVIAA